MYIRIIKEQIIKDLFQGKIIMLIGARQVGKTTLALSLISKGDDAGYFNADDIIERNLLETRNLEKLKGIIGKKKTIIIDEAQKIPHIGETLKLLVDYYKKEKQFIVTGSSSINLLDNTSEPLTGRKFTYYLYPLSLQEIYREKDELFIDKKLEQYLIYGLYPEVATVSDTYEQKRRIKEIANTYLYRDILEYQDIRNPQILTSLLRLLALQVGSEVSLSELSNNLKIDIKTTERYIDLLEKSYVIFQVSAYSNNKRREITRNKKVFFYDNGIRNVLVDNFNEIRFRDDVGALWENFIFAERLKYREYNRLHAGQYFWRTYDGGEVDLVEEHEGGTLRAFELKYARDTMKVPRAWQAYCTDVQLINKTNMKGFVF